MQGAGAGEGASSVRSEPEPGSQKSVRAGAKINMFQLESEQAKTTQARFKNYVFQLKTCFEMDSSASY